MNFVIRTWLEPRVLGAIAAVTAISWLFIEMAEDVFEGELRRIDTAILLALRSADDPAIPLGPLWFQEFVRDISGLGSPGVLTLLVAATVLFLLFSGRHRTALLVLLSTSGGGLFSSLLKAGFERPRPDLVPHAVHVYNASFPSGHAMMSAVVYLTLGALVAQLIPRRSLKLYVMVVAALLAALIGMSRVYLGVHWPSDVLAGWAIGAAWALGCWTAAQMVNRGSRIPGPVSQGSHGRQG